MEISLIAALGRNRVIGLNGRLPWRLPADMAFFKTMTMGKPVIMGRLTWESLNGRKLPGRRIIMLSRRARETQAAATTEDDGPEIAATLQEALTLARRHAEAANASAPEVMIAGGGIVYAAAMPLATRMYLTEVEAAPAGDAFFPEFDRAAWRETARTHHAPGDGAPGFSFVTYQRKNRPNNPSGEA